MLRGLVGAAPLCLVQVLRLSGTEGCVDQQLLAFAAAYHLPTQHRGYELFTSSGTSSPGPRRRANCLAAPGRS